MKSAPDFALWLYSHLLYLYPANFRADYGDEMRDVFAQALAENEKSFALLGLLLAELRDLPVSVIREYIHEGQQTRLVMLLEGFVLNRIYSPQRFRFCMTSLLALTALYTFAAISAYFVFDLHTNSIWTASEWWYAIGNQPGYIGNIFPVALLGTLIWIAAPLWILVVGGLLALMLWQQWHVLSDQLRRWSAIALIAALVMVATMGSPFGYMAALWFYD